MESWINWTDGMRINAEHFTHLQKTIQSRIDYNTSLIASEYVYGFRPMGNIQDYQFLKYENGDIRILGYSGITPNGCWIYFDSPLNFSPKKNNDGYIELQLLPKKHSAYGEQIPEVKHEKLYLKENFEIKIVPAPSMGASVIIGKITNDILDASFIPPLLYWNDLKIYSNDAKNVMPRIREIKKICLDYLSNKPRSTAKKDIAFTLINCINTCELSPDITPYSIYKKIQYLTESIELINLKRSVNGQESISIQDFPSYSSVNHQEFFSSVSMMYYNFTLSLREILQVRESDGGIEVM